VRKETKILPSFSSASLVNRDQLQKVRMMIQPGLVRCGTSYPVPCPMEDCRCPAHTHLSYDDEKFPGLEVVHTAAAWMWHLHCHCHMVTVEWQVVGGHCSEQYEAKVLLGLQQALARLPLQIGTLVAVVERSHCFSFS
jgi:hypothetical protein